MTKEDKEKIRKLKQEGKYDTIFVEYGRGAYLSSISRKYRKEELKRLKRERNYEEIYNKYGDAEYDKILTKAMFDEIRENTNLGKAVAWKVKKILKGVAGVSLASTMLIGGGFPVANAVEAEKNAIEYSELVEDYDKNIKEYSKHVNSMNLTDIQVFMKVMDDMWKNIQGYKTPKLDIQGHLELDLASKDGYGVCRNMASDVARKLNAINPNYNARTMVVYMDSTNPFYISNIERNIISDNETVQDNHDEDDSQKKDDNSIMKSILRNLPNHMVTLVDINDEKLTLALDPTNAAIGVYHDGCIIILNPTLGEKATFDTKEILNAILFSSDPEASIKTASDYIRSFNDTGLNFNEIEAKYGLDAQNKALEEVRAMESLTLDDSQIYQATEENFDLKNDFKSQLAVDVNFIANDNNQLEYGKRDKLNDEKAESKNNESNSNKANDVLNNEEQER